jgi:hypothetical protein
MEYGPYEANRISANQKILRHSWNLNIHYYIHKSPPLVPILRQMNPVHIFCPYLSKIQFNIMYFPST